MNLILRKIKIKIKLLLTFRTYVQKQIYCNIQKTETTDANKYHKWTNIPIISRKSSAKTMGPLSIGFPDPLNTLPTRNSNKIEV